MTKAKATKATKAAKAKATKAKAEKLGVSAAEMRKLDRFLDQFLAETEATIGAAFGGSDPYAIPIRWK